MKKQLILFLCASTLCGAAFAGLPEKKQKNPGRTVERQDQSHDVHELEKISFTVTAEGLGSPPGVTYLKIKVDPNGEEEASGEAVLRLTCAGGELRNAALWTVTGTDASGKRTHHPVTFVKEWGPVDASIPGADPELSEAEARSLAPSGQRLAAGGGRGHHGAVPAAADIDHTELSDARARYRR